MVLSTILVDACPVLSDYPLRIATLGENLGAAGSLSTESKRIEY